MIEIDGEVYLIATEAARFIGASRGQFYNNVKPLIPAHKVGARRRKYYKRSDLECFRTIELVA